MDFFTDIRILFNTLQNSQPGNSRRPWNASLSWPNVTKEMCSDQTVKVILMFRTAQGHFDFLAHDFSFFFFKWIFSIKGKKSGFAGSSVCPLHSGRVQNQPFSLTAFNTWKESRQVALWLVSLIAAGQTCVQWDQFPIGEGTLGWGPHKETLAVSVILERLLAKQAAGRKNTAALWR